MIEPRSEVNALPAYRPGRPEGLGSDGLTNLAANENAWGPSPQAARSLSSLALHRYPDMDGPDLLAELARVWAVQAEELVLGTGSGHLIKCICEAYVRPGDVVLTASPTFSLYGTSALLMGGRVESPPGDAHRVRFAELPAVAERVRPRLVFACSPNNPTGDAMDEETLAALLAALPPEGLLVVDEAYVHFATSPPDTLARVRRGARIAVLRTFSKAYGLAALRLGALCAPRDIIRAVRRVREPFPASEAALRAALAAARDSDHLAMVHQRVREGRARLSRELARRGLRVNPGEGNFLWAEAPEGAQALTAALRQEGVLIRDGTNFGAPRHVRITVGTEDELDRLLGALDRIRQATR